MSLEYPYNHYLYFLGNLVVAVALLFIPFGGRSFRKWWFIAWWMVTVLFFRFIARFVLDDTAGELSATGALAGGSLLLIVHLLWPGLSQKRLKG